MHFLKKTILAFAALAGFAVPVAALDRSDLGHRTDRRERLVDRVQLRFGVALRLLQLMHLWSPPPRLSRPPCREVEYSLHQETGERDS